MVTVIYSFTYQIFRGSINALKHMDFSLNFKERGEADEEAVVAPKPGPNSDEERGDANEEPQSPNSPPP